mmetsp:Transcript_18275/g.61122  ORF Transcript_18275/g.61122 Transcript_18275/m.61122 type:complete len:204 (-) Transcript_18275:899-1510(-)
MEEADEVRPRGGQAPRLLALRAVRRHVEPHDRAVEERHRVEHIHGRPAPGLPGPKGAQPDELAHLPVVARWRVPRAARRRLHPLLRVEHHEAHPGEQEREARVRARGRRPRLCVVPGGQPYRLLGAGARQLAGARDGHRDAVPGGDPPEEPVQPPRRPAQLAPTGRLPRSQGGPAHQDQEDHLHHLRALPRTGPQRGNRGARA